MTSGMMTSEEQRMRALQRSVETLGRQLMMLQLAQQEMWRSDGDSGIKQVRLARDGTRPYHTNTHTGNSMAAMHDHADMRATCGLGEFEAVLNGVHFRTRHNDYPLLMPASTGEYHATVDIPFPAVPPSVLEKKTVEEQAEEMRQWFRAWRDRDHSTRDYRPYFRPLLCYLEGAWTIDTHLDEPFLSHRHHLDATDIRNLQDKIRFAAYTGDKHLQENLAYLPSMLLNVTDEGQATVAQWNYRVLCHPTQQEISLRDLRPVEDLTNRLASRHRWRDYVMSRGARFTLNPLKGEKIYMWNILDKIMKEIPGKNNYGARLVDRTESGLKQNAYNARPLNTAYYHRWYKLPIAGAMGKKVTHTGFADRNLFVADTTQPRVAPMQIPTDCSPVPSPNRGGAGGEKGHHQSCTPRTRRVSYAIPLEVVFLTPLHSWNPYELQYKGRSKSPSGRTVTDNGRRKGALTVEGAYNGTSSRHFYRTPVSFFLSSSSSSSSDHHHQSAQAQPRLEVHSDPADTVKGVVGVLDPLGGRGGGGGGGEGEGGKEGAGVVRKVVASGVRIFLPKIPGVGVLRTRFPIAPVFAEGSTVWKEMEALREVVLEMDRHRAYFRTVPRSFSSSSSSLLRLRTPPPSPSPPCSVADCQGRGDSNSSDSKMRAKLADEKEDKLGHNQGQAKFGDDKKSQAKLEADKNNQAKLEADKNNQAKLEADKNNQAILLEDDKKSQAGDNNVETADELPGNKEASPPGVNRGSFPQQLLANTLLQLQPPGEGRPLSDADPLTQLPGGNNNDLVLGPGNLLLPRSSSSVPAYLLLSSHHTPPQPVMLVTSPSSISDVTVHMHTVEVSRAEWRGMVREGVRLKLRTTLGGGHSHLLVLGFDPDTQYITILSCDDRPVCWDGHSASLERLPNHHHADDHNYYYPGVRSGSDRLRLYD